MHRLIFNIVNQIGTEYTGGTCRIVVQGLGLFLLATGAATLAADLPVDNDPCAKDPVICRNIAIEITKVDLSDYIQLELDTQPERYTLCPEGELECCPPEQASRCMQMQRAIVEQARKRHSKPLHLSIGCPLTAAKCDGLGAVLCDQGETFSSLTGCVPDFSIDRPWPTLPPRCECGQTYDLEKNICKPKTCNIFGYNRSCPLSKACAPVDVIDRSIGGYNSHSATLQRYLADPDVHREAVDRLRNDFQAALQLLEVHAAEIPGSSK